MTINSSKSIGGYFELEIEDKCSFIYNDSILLNSARNCLEYILKAKKIKRLYLSKYSCEAILEPIRKNHIEYEFYSIDKSFEIIDEIDLKKDEFLLYVNYFGIKDNYIKILSEKYSNKIIIDNSQAFYSKPEKNTATFYSPRKFFGVSDGGCLYVDYKIDKIFKTDYSYDRCSHLLKSVDSCTEFGYQDFKDNEESLNNQDIKNMSNLTKKILNSVNYERIKEIRLENFYYLHSVLKEKNELDICLEDMCCPMVYPFLINDNNLRKKLIDKKIFVATYWPNVFDWAKPEDDEFYLAKYLLSIPIDQRYNLSDMQLIINVLSNY